MKQRKVLKCREVAAESSTGFPVLGRFYLGCMIWLVRCIAHVRGNTLEYCPVCALWQVLCWAHGARKLLGPREDDGDEGDNNGTNVYWVLRKGKAPFSKLSMYFCV